MTWCHLSGESSWLYLASASSATAEGCANGPERFYRGKDTWNTSGLGFRPPIAKALVETQDGTITIESQVDRGSVINVALLQAAVRSLDSEAA